MEQNKTAIVSWVDLGPEGDKQQQPAIGSKQAAAAELAHACSWIPYQARRRHLENKQNSSPLHYTRQHTSGGDMCCKTQHADVLAVACNLTVLLRCHVYRSASSRQPTACTHSRAQTLEAIQKTTRYAAAGGRHSCRRYHAAAPLQRTAATAIVLGQKRNFLQK
jgi:hypothetical protein